MLLCLGKQVHFAQYVILSVLNQWWFGCAFSRNETATFFTLMVLLHYIFFHVIQLFYGYINQECQLTRNQGPQQNTPISRMMLEMCQQHRNISKLLQVNITCSFRVYQYKWYTLSSLHFIYKMFFTQYLKLDCLTFHHMYSYMISYQLISWQPQLEIRLHIRSVHKIYPKKGKDSTLRNSRSKIKSDNHKSFCFLNVVKWASGSSFTFKMRLTWALYLH
jgi:hypothetical protein